MDVCARVSCRWTCKLFADLVDLPQVKVIGAECAQRLFQVGFRALPGALKRLKHVDTVGEGAGKSRRTPQDEQDAIESQILASLADEDAWKKSFAEKRDLIRRMAREALEQDEKGETLLLDDLL